MIHLMPLLVSGMGVGGQVSVTQCSTTTLQEDCQFNCPGQCGIYPVGDKVCSLAMLCVVGFCLSEVFLCLLVVGCS